MDISIVIPALNEERKIAYDITTAAFFFGEAGLKGEVIVVDDGSTDRTFHNALTAMVPEAIRRWVVRLDKNSGKGAAVKAGVRETTGAVVLVADSGTCIPYADVLPPYARIRAGETDIALGSRAHPESVLCRNRPRSRRIVSRLFRRAARLVAGLPHDIGDSQCGFKAYRGDAARELFAGLETPGFVYEVEILLKARARGLRTEEFPIHWTCDLDTRLHPRHQAWAVYRELRRVRKIIRLDMGA
jgi:dolichyl-phosphate beta-glucosyltransferase